MFETHCKFLGFSNVVSIVAVTVPGQLRLFEVSQRHPGHDVVITAHFQNLLSPHYNSRFSRFLVTENLNVPHSPLLPAGDSLDKPVELGAMAEQVLLLLLSGLYLLQGWEGNERDEVSACVM